MPLCRLLFKSTPLPAFEAGHVLLRAGGKFDSETIFISAMSGGDYSHSGICSDPKSRMAVDAYPGRDPRAVAELLVDSFFDSSHAPGGGAIYAFTGPPDARKQAAQWAENECRNPYTFALWDPIVGTTGPSLNNKLYCSEFVWWCYRRGAGISLIDPRDFSRLFDPADVEASRQLFVHALRMSRWFMRLAPKSWLTARANSLLPSLTGHNGFFVTPSQLTRSKHLTLVHTHSHRKLRVSTLVALALCLAVFVWLITCYARSQ